MMEILYEWTDTLVHPQCCTNQASLNLSSTELVVSFQALVDLHAVLMSGYVYLIGMVINS